MVFTGQVVAMFSKDEHSSHNYTCGYKEVWALAVGLKYI